MKTFKKILKSKALYIGLSLLIQVIILFLLMTYFGREFVSIYYFMLILSIVVSMFVINRESDTSSKLLWVFMIMALPFFGGILYLLFGGRTIPKALMIQDRQAYADYTAYAEQNLKTLQAHEIEDPTLLRMTSLAWNNGYFPVYSNMGCRYYPKGEDQFEAQMNAIRQAKEYVFIETYIIDEGTVLEEMVELLEQKVKEGVDVRLMYDDFGCILNLPEGFDERLREKGIQVHPFNPIHAQLAIQMNNRDHRKTIIVDGQVAFTGGSNLADEYVNRIERFGYWKDMGIEIRGKAVEPFVIAFLQIWNYEANVNTPYYPYIHDFGEYEPDLHQGYVLPFFDSPTDNLNTGKRFHQNMLSLANQTFWITTPYLILEDEMLSSLKLAVENGVDVRIVVPKIPDKKTVYAVTKANEEILTRYGVKIYEYTPGFIHGKVTLVDDEQALCGTVNMDFRSYYCNYECGTWLYKTPAIRDIRADFEDIFTQSHLVTLEEVNQTNPFVRIYRQILKVFSPLM